MVCKSLVETKLNLRFCRGAPFVLIRKLLFDIFVRYFSEGHETLLLKTLPNTCSETEWNLLGN